jgi:hypothetical protein
MYLEIEPMPSFVRIVGGNAIFFNNMIFRAFVSKVNDVV